MKVAVVDYGLGNLHSVEKALVHLGAELAVARHGDELAGADRIILPGVGAFADGMQGLRDAGHVEALHRAVEAGTPLLGICLGAQLLFDETEEFGIHQGLGILQGRVEKISAEGVKVPHVGWKQLAPASTGRDWTGTPLEGLPAGTWAYFVHSFQMIPTDPSDLLTVVTHGSHTITGAVHRGKVTGCQFHPEKSGAAGLGILRTFLVQ